MSWIFRLDPWLLGALVVAAYLAAGIAGLFVLRTRVLRRAGGEPALHNATVGAFLSPVGTLCGLLLGLVAVTAWRGHSEAESLVTFARPPRLRRCTGTWAPTRSPPINVLNAVKLCPEVCRIFCATANPVQVVLAQTDQGRGILGVVDGLSPKGVEDDAGRTWRHEILRKFAYKK